MHHAGHCGLLLLFVFVYPAASLNGQLSKVFCRIFFLPKMFPLSALSALIAKKKILLKKKRKRSTKGAIETPNMQKKSTWSPSKGDVTRLSLNQANCGCH